MKQYKGIMEDGMKVAFVIWKINHEKNEATFGDIVQDELLKDLEGYKIKLVMEFLIDWGHLHLGSTQRGVDYLRTYDLNYPEAILGYAKLKGWVTITVQINCVDSTKGEKHE
jgi:hypothetical protein